jgi:hypothetical protein
VGTAAGTAIREAVFAEGSVSIAAASEGLSVGGLAKTASQSSSGTNVRAVASAPSSPRSTVRPLGEEFIDDLMPTPGSSALRSRAVSSATRDSSRGRSGAVELNEVMTYGESAKSSAAIVGDMLTLDHMISGAALKARFQRINVGTLSDDALKFIYKEGQGIIIRDSWHKAASRTYGGRNTPAQILYDSLNPFIAQELDIAAMRAYIVSIGSDVNSFDLAAGLLRLRNLEMFEIGLTGGYKGSWSPP